MAEARTRVKVGPCTSEYMLELPFAPNPVGIDQFQLSF